MDLLKHGLVIDFWLMKIFNYSSIHTFHLDKAILGPNAMEDIGYLKSWATIQVDFHNILKEVKFTYALRILFF